MNSLTKISLDPTLQSSVDYISFFVPGIIALTIFYAAVFSASNTVQVDKFTNFDEILDMSPNTPQTVIFGYALGGFIHSLFEVGLVIVIAELTTMLPIPVDFLFYNVVATILTVGTFLFIGIAIAKLVEWEHYTLILSLLTLPVVYLSSIFAPTYSYGQLSWVVAINPLTILLSGYRANLLAPTGLDLVLNIIALLAYCIGAYLLCIFAFNRIPRPKVDRKSKTSKFSRELEKTEPIYERIIQKMGHKTLETIYQLLLDGKAEEAITLFNDHFSSEEIRELFEKLVKS
jgi:ABC-2 type transport system permease protein